MNAETQRAIALFNRAREIAEADRALALAVKIVGTPAVLRAVSAASEAPSLPPDLASTYFRALDLLDGDSRSIPLDSLDAEPEAIASISRAGKWVVSGDRIVFPPDISQF